YSKNWAYIGVNDSRCFIAVKHLSYADYTALTSGSSGSNTKKLQQTLEKLTGIRLDELLQRHVFDPLGMERAAMIWTPAMRHTLAATWD
ncbi:MAG: serine hydrolase, partial [Clostridia bacterium]|nr:serine hydrolase [Clostridia bacterium]